MENHHFYKFILPIERHLFNELSNSVDFEELGKGRKGNLLVNPINERVPIVRTTTKYNKPAHLFSMIHHSLIENINRAIAKNKEIQDAPLYFNNALIEIYDQSYTKMNYHSDQCLDLAAHSYIALFSCYEQPDNLSEYALRKLKVQCKTTAEEFEFTLENNSVILFSLSTNAKFLHKIVLEPLKGVKPINSDNKWLGITFRQSKTGIHFKDNLPYFPNGELLELADTHQSKEFYTLRGQENKGMNFIYPDMRYTLSVSDLMMPIEK
jgi:hypothetical protein